MKSPSPFNKYLVLGTLFIITGGLLLLWTTGYFPGIEALWPLPVILVGLSLLYSVFVKGGSDKNIFPGMFITLAGVFIIISNTFLEDENIIKVWPVFMFITGISIIPLGYRKKGNKRISLLIPAFVLVFLSLVFMAFSLGLINMRLGKFVAHWWPFIFILLGCFFIINYLLKQKKYKK